MSAAFGLTCINQATPDLVSEIFTHLGRGCSSELVHHLFTREINYGGTKQEVKCSPRNVTNNFLELQNELQSKHNIRIALLNRLHQSGLALHILGNCKIKNVTPDQAQKSP